METKLDITLDELAYCFESLIPNRQDRRLIFSLLLDQIRYCEGMLSAAWSVTLLSHGFRLNIGAVEAMTVSIFTVDDDAAIEDGTQNGVTVRMLVADEGWEEALADRATDDYFSVEPYNYAVVGAPHWCYTAAFMCAPTDAPGNPTRTLIAEDLEIRLKSNRRRFVFHACHTRAGTVRQRSNFAKSHCPALIEYATCEAGGAAMTGTIASVQRTRYRLGQSAYRQGVMELWGRRCCITGVTTPSLLRASHSKRWADCTSDSPERLDIYNGLLLVMTLDAFYDKGDMTVMDNGKVVFSKNVLTEDLAKLGLKLPLRVHGLQKEHLPYLRYHRENYFKG